MEPPQKQHQQQDPSAPAIKFRTTKTRKTLRQRPQQHPQHHHQQSSPSSSPPPTPVSDTEPSVTAALRARNAARKPRLGGVAFSTDGPAARRPAEHDADEPNKLVLAKGIPDRFMHQTGLVSTLNDKHMTEYIESHLSSRAAPPPSHSLAEHAHMAFTPTASSSNLLQRAVQPTRHGKLVEVDLSSQAIQDDDKDRNKRNLDGSLAPASRRWNRRGSDDVKRDQLVEAFLHENKLDVYDVPARRPTNRPHDGRSVDERMAEEFRRRYFDEMAARRQRKKPIPRTRQQREMREMRASEILKGPKLGGSRNQRAAVRNILLQQAKEEKTGRKT